MAEASKSQERISLHRAVQIAFEDFNLRLKGVTDLSTPYISGKPGGGKSQSIRAEAKRRGFGYLGRNMGLERVEYLGGIPDFKKIKNEDTGEEELHTVWAIPEIITNLRVLSKKYPAVVCHLMDWHLTNPQLSAIGFEAFTDYTIKGYKIPLNTVFILDGNDTAAAGARTQFSAVMNRVAKMYIETDFDYWRDNYAIPYNLLPEIVSFLEAKDNRHHFHGDEDVNNPWASPRTWTNLSNKISGLRRSLWSDLSEFEKTQVCSSHVGIEAASAFQTYYNIYMSFNTKQIYDTGKYTIPKDPIDRFAFGSAISSEFYNRYSSNDKRAADVYFKILSDLNKSFPEIGMKSIRYIAIKDAKILIELARKHPEITPLLNDLRQTSEALGRR
jgi:hypothetical protein